MGVGVGLSSREAEERPIQNLIRWLSRRRLVTPAILLLEVVKPFGFLIGQALLLGEPLLGFLFDSAQITNYADLLGDRAGVERLIARLEIEAEDRPS